MSARSARLRKLLDLRQKQLDECVVELTRAREREQQAALRAENEARELESALERRSSLAETAALSDRWSSENDWIELRGSYHEAATAALCKAQLSRQRAHGEVLHARSQLKKMEVLQDRLRREEQRAEERKDQRLHDELSQKNASRGAR